MDSINRRVRTAGSQSELDYINEFFNRRDKIHSFKILVQDDSSFREFNGLPGFLQLFPHIKYIVLDYKHASRAANATLRQILQQCLIIESLYYGPGLVTDTLLEATVHTQYPTMMYIAMCIQHFSALQIRYISGTFVNARFIKLLILDTVYNRDLICDLIHTFKRISRIESVLHGHYCREDIRAIIDDFYSFSRHAITARSSSIKISNTLY